MVLHLFEKCPLEWDKLGLVTQRDWQDSTLQSFTKKYVLNQLLDNGVDVRFLRRLHAKAIVSDWDRAVIGSQNFTYYSQDSYEISFQLDRLAEGGAFVFETLEDWWNWAGDEVEDDYDDEDEGEPSDDESPVKKGPAKAKAQAARRPADSGTADGASKASASKKPASAHAAGAARPLASPRPAGTSGAAGARAADLNTVSEMRKDKTARFEAKNQERYKWLLDVRDKDGNSAAVLIAEAAAYAKSQNLTLVGLLDRIFA